MVAANKNEHRSGYIGIIGRPNVGKSTLLNALLNQKLAITSPRPQTTRNRILGIKTVPGGQMIFLDTPGIHPPKGHFNERMVQEALRTLQDVELILLIVEADGSGRDDDRYILRSLESVRTPILLVVNKTDLVKKTSLLPLIEEYARLYDFESIVPISALQRDGVDTLEEEIFKRLPGGPQYFPDDQLTDATERFMASELIREKVFRICGQEIPYAVAVVVDDFQERTPPEPIYVRASLYVEKDSQKGIVIGAGGKMLRRIGEAARKDIEKLLGRSVYLDLWVKVEKNWSKNDRVLRKMGYR